MKIVLMLMKENNCLHLNYSYHHFVVFTNSIMEAVSSAARSSLRSEKIVFRLMADDRRLLNCKEVYNMFSKFPRKFCDFKAEKVNNSFIQWLYLLLLILCIISLFLVWISHHLIVLSMILSLEVIDFCSK